MNTQPFSPILRRLAFLFAVSILSLLSISIPITPSSLINSTTTNCLYHCSINIRFISAVSAAEPPKLSWSQNYQTKTNLHDYFVSEELDGVRGYWNGKQLLSRSGLILNAPAWFTKNFPSNPLDGELWIARGQFEKVVSVVRKKNPIDQEWQQIKYCVFDLPASPDIFSDRLAALSKPIPKQSKSLQLVEQFRVKDQKELAQHLKRIEQLGGEGLMLHHQSALYQQGDNSQLLKSKIAHDAEAKVIGHKSGRGKYRGMMGALQVENADGIVFFIGTGFSDQQRKHPPKIGDVVTYRYRGLTRNSVPKHASFLRIRYDDDL